MRALLVAATIALCPCLAQTASVSVTDQNSSLKFTIDDPTSNLNVPNDPVQLPRTVEWTVDGRRILVYPSSPLTFVDIGHIHADAHVGTNQIHAQGPLLGHGTGATTGTVTGGVAYSVNGGAAGSGVSRITEKVDIHNKSGSTASVLLAGLGFKPTQASLEVPDLTGLSVTGTTLIYSQGTPQAGTLTEPPFAPLTVLPVVTFTGFNPLLNQSFNLPDGAVLTMVTELKVAPAPWLTITVVWVLLVALLVLAAGTLLWRQRRRSSS